MKLVRTSLVALAAVVTAAAVIATTEALAHALLTGSARFGAATAGYGLGALVSVTLATHFGAPRVAIAVPVLLGALAAVNLFAFPHPVWFAPLGITALVVGWALGRWLGSRRHATATAS